MIENQGLNSTFQTLDFESIEPERVNRKTLQTCHQTIRDPLIKGFLRVLVNKWFCIRYGIRCMGEGFQGGKDWDIKRGVLRIGHFVYIGPRVQIIYPTVIGDLSLISAGVNIVNSDHGYHHPGIPIRIDVPDKLGENTLTTIGSEVWIGQNSIIFAGIAIGKGSIIGAGSVVTKDVSPYSIMAGSSARLIRTRFTPEEQDIHERELYG